MKGNFPICAEGFELKPSEGWTIISVYLLRNAGDGKAGVENDGEKSRLLHLLQIGGHWQGG